MRKPAASKVLPHKMVIPRAAHMALLTLAAIGAARAEDVPLAAGAYEVQVRLELPHVESNAGRHTTTICLAGGATGDIIPPVLSGNNPLASCPASNVRRSGDSLSFDIACAGANAARARAVYRLSAQGFEGRIAMTMGGKNMTMTEVQVGRRVGACEAAR